MHAATVLAQRLPPSHRVILIERNSHMNREPTRRAPLASPSPVNSFMPVYLLPLPSSRSLRVPALLGGARPRAQGVHPLHIALQGGTFPSSFSRTITPQQSLILARAPHRRIQPSGPRRHHASDEPCLSCILAQCSEGRCRSRSVSSWSTWHGRCCAWWRTELSAVTQEQRCFSGGKPAQSG